MYESRKSAPRPGKSSSPVVLIPWRQSIRVPKQSKVSQRSAMEPPCVGCDNVEGMNQAAVVDWLKAYMHAWETYSPDAIGDLFTEDATYSFHPYDAPVVGRQAIVDAWLKDPDAPGTFEA